MRAIALTAAATLAACGADPYAPMGSQADVAIYTPDVEDIGDTGAPSATGPGPFAGLRAQDDPTVSGPPLVEPGDWAMQVVTAEGGACWSSVGPGETGWITVESTPQTATLMGFVHARAFGPDRAAGAGARSGEIAPDCVRTEGAFADLRILDDGRMDGDFELTITHSGDGCAEMKAPVEDCAMSWSARMWLIPEEPGGQ